MDKASEIIALYDSEQSRAANFLNLYQDTSDYIYPMESQITTHRAGGQAHPDIVDTTAVFDAQDMASGLSSTMVPPGQPFFTIESSDSDANELDENKRYLSLASEKTHEAIWGSNFLMQFDEFLKSWVIFGEGCLFNEWSTKDIVLNFREFTAGSFHYREDYQRIPDTFIEKFELTARQAMQQFGEDKLPQEITSLANDPLKSETPVEFIHVCRPRKNRDPEAIDTANMAWEDVFVEVSQKKLIDDTGGFETFPYHIGRWAKSAKESRGRGVGVYILPQVRGLNMMKKDLIECGNRHNNPPSEIGPGVEGILDFSPRGLNYVSTMNSIRPLTSMAGNFPYTAEMIASERSEIHRAFMIDVFNQLSMIPPERATTMEINERLKEGLRRLATPVGRLIAEVMDKLVTRSYLLLVSNGRLPEPPPELQGKGIKVNYTSFLVLMLRQYQANAFVRWIQLVSEAEAVFPGVKDNVDADIAIRDMADTFGVKVTHKRSLKKVDEIRQQRASLLEQQQQMEMQQQAAQAYKQTTKAPQEGSLAEVALNG
jgi:hypothetical protein